MKEEMIAVTQEMMMKVVKEMKMTLRVQLIQRKEQMRVEMEAKMEEIPFVMQSMEMKEMTAVMQEMTVGMQEMEMKGMMLRLQLELMEMKERTIMEQGAGGYNPDYNADQKCPCLTSPRLVVQDNQHVCRSSSADGPDQQCDRPQTTLHLHF